MSREANSILGPTWTKTRRNGNDELPTDRVAVKIIRTSRTDESPETSTRIQSPKKQTVTKVSKFVYEPKQNPTSATLKSIHSYRLPQPNRYIDSVAADKIRINTDDRKASQQSKPDTEHLSADFAQKKEQRQKDVTEFQNMLKEIVIEQPVIEIPSKNPSKPDNPPKMEEPLATATLQHTTRTSKSSTQRSKTDPSITTRGRSSTNEQLSTARRQPSSRSKSSANRTGSESQVPVTKRKSYDPEKAKQYIQDQKERRRVQYKTVATQKVITKTEREEIKKRLENLRKNTLTILNKNVKRARKKSVDVVDPPKSIDREKPPTEPQSSSQCDIQSAKIPLPKASKPIPKVLQSANNESKFAKIPADFKKIGLLRKTSDDFNERPIECLSELQMNKENIVVFDVEQPKFPTVQIFESKPPNTPKLNAEISADINQEKTTSELELNVPDVKLKSRRSLCEKSTQFELPVPTKTPIPYWLQPTPVQVYPYNFIMAVRKKLEAITNPILVAEKVKIDNAKKSIPDTANLWPTASLSHPLGSRRRLSNRPDYNELSSLNSEQIPGAHKVSTASSVFTPFLNSSATSPKRNSEIHPNVTLVSLQQQEQSKSLSDITSSVTVNIPQSNTVSEASSIHSDGLKHPPMMSSTKISNKNQRQKNFDDTTASSSVFSSPEKHANKRTTLVEKSSEEKLSPLSVSNINNLNLKSKLSNRSQIEEKSDVNFEKLLQDFNKSLSQVIEVNQQLQFTLTKTPRTTATSKTMNIPASINTQRGSKSSKSDNYYSSDFDEAATSDKTVNKASDDSNEILSKFSGQNLSNRNSNRSSSTIATVETADKSTTRSANAEVVETIYSVPLSFHDADKNASTESEELLDSIEEISKVSKVSVFSSPNQKPHDLNDFSKDSLDFSRERIAADISKSDQYMIRNQINTCRGDSYTETNDLNIFVSQPGDSKLMSDSSIPHRRFLNSSIGSDIFAVFNQSEMELSIISQSSRLSETHLNYSTLGLYEQLLKTETTKTEHLTALLKIREKSILDRTRGQIALLEIQKEKCKARGLTVQITTIKKKQRAILMKMEREREEIKRILKSSVWETDSHKKILQQPNLPKFVADVSLRKNPINSPKQNKSSMMKGFELESSNNLELLLQEREKELNRRREHVERLVKWHQRLDKEEQDVLRIEQMLFEFNRQKHVRPKSIESKRQRKIMDIDKSLRELQSISSQSADDTSSHRNDRDSVRTSGSKMNKLWRRLTGRLEMKFDDTKKYKLSKMDLEKLYEDAKRAVLDDFDPNNVDENRILSDQSKQMNSTPRPAVEDIIPSLNLSFSSEASETECMPSNHSNVEFNEKATTSDTSATSRLLEDIGSGNKETEEYTENFTSSDERRSSESIPMEHDSEIPWITSASSLATISNKQLSEDADLTVIVNSSCTPEINEDLSSTKSDDEEIYVGTSPNDEPIAENSINHNKTDTEECNTCENLSPTNLAAEIKENENSTETITEIEHLTEVSEKLSHDISFSENETMLEDISQPKFELTVDDMESQMNELLILEEGSKSSISDVQSEQQESSHDEESITQTELEKRLIDLDESLKGLHQTFERALSPDKLSPPSNTETLAKQFEVDEDDDKENRLVESSATKLTVKDYLLNPETSTNLMPDIINEVEIRRRQQILIESDIKQLENAVPYVLLREIPNKPPPPYVPPAHGSPMTTIFPSEARIKEITFRRTKELYEEINENEKSSDKSPETLPSILNESITNIYERIILDICKECVHDYQPTFTANSVHVGNYKMPLALYNPPDRLKCLQEFVYKQVRKLLAMDKRRPRYNSLLGIGRRKRDHVDEILIQELFEEEHKWTNFDLEEAEVRESVVDEVLNDLVNEVINDFEIAYNKKRGS